MRVPALVGDNIREANYYVSFDDPKAVDYVLGHLDEVKGYIDRVLKILVFHGEDVAQVSNELKRWLDGRVRDLTR